MAQTVSLWHVSPSSAVWQPVVVMVDVDELVVVVVVVREVDVVVRVEVEEVVVVVVVVVVGVLVVVVLVLVEVTNHGKTTPHPSHLEAEQRGVLQSGSRPLLGAEGGGLIPASL
jgi:hypothetical protein